MFHLTLWRYKGGIQIKEKTRKYIQDLPIDKLGQVRRLDRLSFNSENNDGLDDLKQKKVLGKTLTRCLVSNHCRVKNNSHLERVATYMK